MKRITVLGNFSGRNAGDNAILGNLLVDVSERLPDVQFLVPTLNAGFVRRHFGEYNVRALGLMPWNGALKIFGIPTARAMWNTDLVLITDNILFDRQFFNPAFNYLSTIGLLAPGCRRRGIPLCLYNASVGPVHTRRGAAALQKVLDASPVAVLRDEASARVIRDWNLRAPELIQGADCALNTTPPGPERLRELFRQLGIEDEGRPALGFNVNAYIDAWKAGGGEFGRKRFVGLMAGVLDRLVGSLDADVVFFVTQVMDHTITREIVAASRRRERIRIASNPEYAYDELAGIMSRLRLLVGMRTHALILSCSVGTPIVNVNAYPKSRGFLSTLGMDHWSLDMDTLDAESLHATVMRAWAERDSTRAHLLPAVERERRKAKASAEVVARLLDCSV